MSGSKSNLNLKGENGGGGGTMLRKGREPYKATRLWMEAVAIFRKGVPLGKHRRQWRTYEDTFIASEAITWFQAQLQQIFLNQRGGTGQQQQQAISRQQTLLLLQKMYKARIFQSVSSCSGLSFLSHSPTSSSPLGYVNEADFKDNGQLYRLNVSLDSGSGTPDRKSLKTGTSGSSRSRRSYSGTPSKSTANSKQQTDKENDKALVAPGGGGSNYSVIIRPLSLGQINAIWEQHFMQRFSEIVGSPDVIRCLYKLPNLIPGHWISHNLTQIGKYGIVSNKGGEDLPRWLVIAMKCMANWPNAHSSTNPTTAAVEEHPNYPGFETDVFKLIADYFNKTCLSGKGPLLTVGLYDAFITSFIHAELYDFNTRLYATTKTVNATPTPAATASSSNHANARHFHRWKSTFASPATATTAFYCHEEQYPFNASESIENLLFDILTPQTRAREREVKRQDKKKGATASAIASAMKPKRILHTQSQTAETADAAGDVDLEETSRASGDELEEMMPEPMAPKDYEVTRYSASSIHPADNPSCYYYETAFTNDSSPLTRVVSKTELQTSFGSAFSTNILGHSNAGLGFGSSIDFDNTQTQTRYTYAYENPTLDLSGSELIHHPKYSKLVNNSAGLGLGLLGMTTTMMTTSTGEASTASTSTAYSFGQYSTESTATASNSISSTSNQRDGIEDWNNLDNFHDHGINQTLCCGEKKAKVVDFDGFSTSTTHSTRLYGNVKLRSFSAIDLSDSQCDRSPYTFSRIGNFGNRKNGNENLGKTLPGNKFGESLQLQQSQPTQRGPSARRNLDFYYGADACIPGLMTREGKQMAIQSFRLLTLLIPPINRRQLQLLLRCMAKMARNEKLMLDVAMTTRAIVINTFFKNILHSDDDNQFDELLALRIVTFMMDNDSEIFCVKDENPLVEAVNEAIRERQIIKEPNLEPEPKPVTPKSKKSPKISPATGKALIIKENNTNTPKIVPISEKTPSKEIMTENVTPKPPKPPTKPKVSKNNTKTPFAFTPKQVQMQAEDNKENLAMSPVQYCSRITLNEFEDQKLLGGTGPALRHLLDALLQDPKMNRKQKKERLDQFVREYPHIFIEKFGDQLPDDVLRSYTEDSTSLEVSLGKSTAEKTKPSKSSNPFNKLFKNLRL